jgi:hypothetical protein
MNMEKRKQTQLAAAAAPVVETPQVAKEQPAPAVVDTEATMKKCT